jgi:hypothetical protein
VSPRREVALLCARDLKVQQGGLRVNGKEVVELAERKDHIGRADSFHHRGPKFIQSADL